ncbi:MAG: hypothetical protein JTT11_02870 [Candidatus Brockarchaeota archaeon]|nr:hypothetical protein [Candidatus Brockarchaeota archaeon]
MASTPSFSCPRHWTSLRAECRKCKDRMSCALYVEDWKKKRKMMRRSGM